MTRSCHIPSVRNRQLGGPEERLDPVRGAELAIDAAHLVLDRVLAAAEDFRHFPGALSLAQPAQHLQLAHAEPQGRCRDRLHRNIFRRAYALQHHVQRGREQPQRVGVTAIGSCRDPAQRDEAELRSAGVEHAVRGAVPQRIAGAGRVGECLQQLWPALAPAAEHQLRNQPEVCSHGVLMRQRRTETVQQDRP